MLTLHQHIVRIIYPSTNLSAMLNCLDDDEVEQQLTVIPRIGSLRRKSLMDYAFPELHQKVSIQASVTSKFLNSINVYISKPVCKLLTKVFN